LYRQSQLWFKFLKIKFKTKRKQKSSGGHSPSLAGLYERLVDETKAKQQNHVIKIINTNNNNSNNKKR
jgi:hypothetical protein